MGGIFPGKQSGFWESRRLKQALSPAITELVLDGREPSSYRELTQGFGGRGLGAKTSGSLCQVGLPENRLETELGQ